MSFCSEPVALAFLENLGARRVKHSGRTLYDHLLGTYRLLTVDGRPPHVCLGGLYHSIYGTNQFQHVLTNGRDRVRAVIGDEAEELAYLFSTIDRPRCFLTAPTIPHRRDLVAIEIANLTEQGAGARWVPKLLPLLG